MRITEIIPPKCWSHHKNFAEALHEYENKYLHEYNLYEGLITSQSREKTISIIKRRFPKSMNFRYEPNENDFLIFLHKSAPIVISSLIQLINNLGWYIAEIQLDNQSFNGNNQQAINQLKDFNFTQAWLTIQAKYDIEVDTPPILYHATPTNKEQKILKVGLSPKTQSLLSYHPERVYFTTTIEGLENLLNHLGEAKGIKDWTILEIDTSKIPSLKHINYLRIFKDPSYPHKGKDIGLYTLNNIPSSAIKVLKRIKIK